MNHITRYLRNRAIDRRINELEQEVNNLVQQRMRNFYCFQADRMLYTREFREVENVFTRNILITEGAIRRMEKLRGK